MSRVVRFCRKCGSSIVPGARFCNSCGTPVDPQSTIQNKNAILESAPQIEETLEEEQIPPEEFKQLVTTYNVWRIEEKLKPVNMKLEELIAKKEVGELTDDQYNSESAGLKEEKELLEEELTKKMEVKPLSMYFLTVQEKEAAERLSKLENIFGENKISQTTYSKLKREYSEKLQSVRNELTSERHKLTKWKKILEKELSNVKMTLEESLVRYEIGEISEEEYQPKKSDLEEKKKDMENSQTLINFLLS
jgi:hypothetical protein